MGLPPHAIPPAPYGFHRETRGVVVKPNAHPAHVVANIVYSVGNGLTQLLVHKVVNKHLLGFAFGPMFTATIFESVHQLLLLGVYRYDRLPIFEEFLSRGIDALKLGVTVFMGRPFQGLSVRS